jgi:hypothetical protein
MRQPCAFVDVVSYNTAAFQHWRGIILVNRIHVFMRTLSAMLFLMLISASHLVAGEAINGEPFGVGHLALVRSEPTAVDLVAGHRCYAKDGHLLYPVFAGGQKGDSIAAPPTDLYFLFRGPAPREVTVYAPDARTYPIRVVVDRNDRQRRRLLARWWKEYRTSADRQFDHGLVPSSAATYFREMLEVRVQPQQRFERLRARIEEEKAAKAQSWQALEFLLGLERLRTQAVSDLWTTPEEPRAYPLPLANATGDNLGRDVHLPLPEQAPDIEPLATRVPQECYYIRFGTFSNYLWFHRLLDENGGDLATMVTLRSTDDAAAERQQTQLGLKQSVLADILGDRVIADVALIGYDLYTADGAAMGILFEGKNELLGGDLTKQRRAALAAHEKYGATEKTIKVGDKVVSLMSTPDNRFRSFYARDGAFHLVTNCRHLVEEFLKPANERRTLADLRQFHHARHIRPAVSDDTVFAYFSTPFFMNLTSPHYQVELARRFQSEAALQVLTLSSFAALNEGIPQDIESMTAAGLLPPLVNQDFVNANYDVVEGNFVDRQRGLRGSLLPIPDTDVDMVTATEVGLVRANQQFYAENWRQFDPLMFAAQRHRTDVANRERISLTIQASPFDEEKLRKYTSFLAPPTSKRITPAAGDVLFVQAALQGGAWAPDLQTHHFLFGIQDSPVPWPLPPENFWDTLRLVKATPAYLASWPRMGLLDKLPFQLQSEPDPQGFMRLPLGLWRLDRGLFTAVGFHREVLGWAADHIDVFEGEQPAQVRLYVGDLSQSSLRPFVDGLQLKRATLSSAGGARWMNYLGQQLSLPPDNSRSVAEQLTGATPLCPLGGDYTVQATGPGAFWISTALLGPPTDDTFEAPVMQWFRGLSADLLHHDGSLRIRAELDMQRAPTQSLLQLPKFDFLPKNRPDVLPAPKRKAKGKGPVDF